MSIRKRGKKWVVQVYDPREGGKVWVGTFDTREEAKEAEHKAWLEVKASRGRRKETIDSFAARWMRDYPRSRESTRLHYEDRIKGFAREYEGRDLRSVDCVEARAWALAHRSNFAVVRAMFSDAKRSGLCFENPFADLRLEGSRGRRDLVVPSEEELGALALKARELHGDFGRRVLANFIMFGAYSGLRPGELYGLRWKDIDLSGSTVRVERQFNAKTRTFTDPKTEMSKRTIYLTPQARDALEATARVRDEVFSAPRGGILSGTSISSYWRPVANSVGRPEFTPHCLRHFYGTLLGRKQMHPKDIGKILGHDDGGALALKRYVHTTDDEANAATARLFGGSVRELRSVSGGN